MSQTSTVPQTRTAISRSSSILLSPSKRRKLNDDEPKQQLPKRESTNVPAPTESSEKVQPTPAELYRWSFTSAAITPCFVRDVFEMKASGFRDMEFFWLGRIPCRTVRLIGLLVGVTVWDRRTVYTIDDGTAVLDCAFAHVQVVPPSPVKPKLKAAAPSDNTKRGGASHSDYLLSARKVSAAPSAPPSRAEPPPPPKPVARVGQSVRVVGRVVSRYDTRILLVDEISPCTSYNDEPNHWLAVSDLHRTTYYPPEALPPFIPPPLPTAFANQSYSRPGSPSKRATTQEPATPASVRFIAPSAMTSPSTSVATSSPASSTAGDVKQIRLRHPSRLHTRDLTANTFRIYVKHYMDNAPPPPPRRRRSETRSVSPSPTPSALQSRKDFEDTPTKTRGTKRTAAVDVTPRPSRRRRLEENHTPRASQRHEAESDAGSESEAEDNSEGGDQMYGFTLSHLRRVPELSLLARRVIAADAHRREKEERKKARDQASQSKGKGKAPTTSSSSRSRETGGPTGPAVKKLFKQAIRTLFQEGDIVLWSGPVRPLPAPSLDPMLPAPSASQLWKANTSTSTTSSAISSASTSSRSRPSYEEWDDEVLSDPQPNEEAYVPLTPAYFSRVLEDAIRHMVREKMAKVKRPEGNRTPRPSSKSIIERLREQEKERGSGPPPGPTKEELLTWLRNSDERWARVGEWTVEEALNWGRKEGRLWCIGKGRWEVCE